MSAVEKIGCPDWFPIWSHGPWVAAGIVFAAYFLAVNLLMLVEGRFARGRYLTFLVGGLVCWPAIAAYAAMAIEGSGPLSRPFTEPWFHAALLALGVIVALLMEVGPLKDGTFTWAQEVSPSKLYHTVIFGPLLYVIAMSVIIVIIAINDINQGPLYLVGIVAALVMFTIAAAVDRVVYWTRDKADPHVEWSWTEFTVRPRFVEAEKRGLRGGASR